MYKLQKVLLTYVPIDQHIEAFCIHKINIEVKLYAVHLYTQKQSIAR